MNRIPLTIEQPYMAMYLDGCADLVRAMDACQAERDKASKAWNKARTAAGMERANARRDAFWTAYWECKMRLEKDVATVRDKGGLLHLHQRAATKRARELEQERMAADTARWNARRATTA